jgi:acyl-coenzyme A thioesterase PaaI-like protein
MSSKIKHFSTYGLQQLGLNFDPVFKQPIMFDPFVIIEKAKNSSFYMRVLNWSLNRMIPFNKPHDFTVIGISDNHLKTRIPYIRKNFNHIRGLHACALATLSEFTTGFLLVTRLDGKKYRLIMQRLEMEYHYQGKMDAFAEFRIPDNWISTSIEGPLKTQESVVVVCEVLIHDARGNHLTTGKVHWQVKDWSKVKTKV